MSRRRVKERPRDVVVGKARARPRRGPRNAGKWYWQAVVYEDSKERTGWTGWATLTDVERILAKLIAEGGLETPRAASVSEIEPTRDLVDCWVAVQESRADLSPRTVVGYRNKARHVGAVLDETRLDRVDTTSIERYRDEQLRAGYASSTVKAEMGVLNMAWNWGRQMGACPDRQLPKVHLKVKPAREKYTPPLRDVLAVIDKLDRWPRLAAVLMMGTGARIREIATLRWADVIFDAGTIRIRESKTRPRTIPVAEDVMAELRRHGPGRPEAGLFGVLPETVMGQMRVRYLPRACEQAGVKRFTPHALRRAAVDGFARNGVDVGTAAAYLGHSPKVMLNHYRQATAADLRDAVERSGLGRATSKVVPFPDGGRGRATVSGLGTPVRSLSGAIGRGTVRMVGTDRNS